MLVVKTPQLSGSRASKEVSKPLCKIDLREEIITMTSTRPQALEVLSSGVCFFLPKVYLIGQASGFVDMRISTCASDVLLEVPGQGGRLRAGSSRYPWLGTSVLPRPIGHMRLFGSIINISPFYVLVSRFRPAARRP